MINVILVDDEQPALDELEYMLKDFTCINISGKFNEAKKALEYVLLNDTDVCFLDISMPEMDGFMLAETLIKLRKPPLIIFATAYDEYAIKAFEVNAVDYLLKPVTDDRLSKTINRISLVLKEENQTQDEVEQLIKTRYKDKKASRLPLWKNDRIHLVNPNDIDYVETKDGETILYTKKGVFISSDSLTHYEEILTPYNFFRCHRSYLINLEDITEVIPWFNNTYAVKIAHYEEPIPVSRRNIKTFKEILNL